MKPHSWLEFEIPEADAGRLAQLEDVSAQRSLIPCQGCGEHRVITDQEMEEADSLDRVFWCGRCRERRAVEAALERGFADS